MYIFRKGCWDRLFITVKVGYSLIYLNTHTPYKQAQYKGNVVRERGSPLLQQYCFECISFSCIITEKQADVIR